MLSKFKTRTKFMLVKEIDKKNYFNFDRIGNQLGTIYMYIYLPMYIN